LLRARRDAAAIILDAGGGYASGVESILRRGHQIDCVLFKGSAASTRRTPDKLYQYENARSEAIMAFADALKAPDCRIALPNDNRLLAEMCAHTWYENGSGKIQVIDKDQIRKLLGRSPDRLDATYMCWQPAQRALHRRLSGPDSMGRAQRGV